MRAPIAGILLSCICILTGAGVSAQAQGANSGAPKKIAIQFLCTCTDSTGQAFATAFRDLLATSPRYYEAFQASEKSESGKITYNFKVSAVSIDTSSNNNGLYSAISVVFLIGDDGFLDHIVQVCARDHAAGCASDALASFDSTLTSLLQANNQK